MARKSRMKSTSGIYHLIMRGINRQNIFEDNEDNEKFINTLELYQAICKYEVYAYCLMGNHIHILLKVCKEPLEQIMRRICGSYVFWYNSKYERVGNLFQDRFKSEPVENDGYFIRLIRYIHQNPVKAGIVENVENYKWSSYNEYIKKGKFVYAKIALEIFDSNKENALKLFIQYINESNDDKFLENENYKLTDEEAKNIIKKICNIDNAVDLQKLEKVNRNYYLRKLKEIQGFSIKRLERLTGINRGIILRA